MTDFDVEVRVTPREGLLDPQGKAVHHALESLGFGSVGTVRVGRLIRLRIESEDSETARVTAVEMCRKLLANPVTEEFDVEVAAHPAVDHPDTGDVASSSVSAGPGGER